jgi:hypothetical protein
MRRIVMQEITEYDLNFSREPQPVCPILRPAINFHGGDVPFAGTGIKLHLVAATILSHAIC